MQLSQVQQRFAQVEQCIKDAARMCQSANAPQELKDCLSELNSQSNEAKQTIQNSQDEFEIRDCVDSLEQLGDEAMNACRSADGVDSQLRDAVKKAHDELSQFKHQLH